MTVPNFSYAGRFSGDRNVAAHQHSGIELILTIKGESIQQIGNQFFQADPCAMLVVPPKTSHIQINRGLVETIYAVFYADEFLFPAIPRRIDINTDALILRWMTDLTQLHNPAEQEQGNNIIAALLSRLKNIEQQTNIAVLRHPALTAAIELMQHRFAASLDIDWIAVHAGVSTSYLNALFNREFGIGPLKYLQNIRMAHACQLLRNPYLTVAEISNMCGYEHSYYFCRIFKKNHNCTPNSYRQGTPQEARTHPPEMTA